MDSYYTMVNDDGNEELGLIQVYTPDEKQNIISYLVGTTDGSSNKLKLYKFSADSNIVGPMQLDQQIEEDEAISAELESLNTTGTRLTKQMIIVPINNTLLYVEPIYQTMLNESEIPLLKKVVVASGNKVAIGDTLSKALQNLLSQYAVDIEVENTEDIEGLIDAIIKANDNLTESNNSNDWELMGSDLKRLQELINSLEELKAEEDQKQEELNSTTDNNADNLGENNSTSLENTTIENNGNQNTTSTNSGSLSETINNFINGNE